MEIVVGAIGLLAVAGVLDFVPGGVFLQGLLGDDEEETDDVSPSRAVNSATTVGDAQRRSVAPDEIEEHRSYIVRRNAEGEEQYVRGLIVSSFPSRVAHGWLNELFVGDSNVRVSYHIWPRDPDSMIEQLKIRSTRLRGEIQDKKEDGRVDTMEAQQELEQVERLRNQLTRGATNLFNFAMYIEVLGEDKDELDDRTGRVRSILSQSNARVTPLYDRQLDIQRSVAPLATDPVRNTQVMDTAAMETTFPFIEQSVVQPSGVLLGFHDVTGTPIVVDRFELSGHNMLISGKIGSGKSYLAKLAVWRRLMMDPETELFIIDPVGGMGDLVDAIGGDQIRVGGEETSINPMEIQETTYDEAEVEANIDPYQQKVRSVMGLFHTHFEGRRELSKEEEGLLRRAVRLAYLKQGITPDEDTHHRTSPVIGDVIDVLERYTAGETAGDFIDADEDADESVKRWVASLKETESRQSSDRMQDIAFNLLMGMEGFKEGGQNDELNGRPENLDLDGRVIQFDLSQVAQDNNDLMMHVVLDMLFQRARGNDGRTVVVIDEAHYMLQQPEALDMLELFARHSRHYDSGMTLISQTVDEFMKNEQTQAIYDQCDIRALMRHENLGDEALDALNLTERERQFVMSAQAGNSAKYSQSLLHVTDVGKLRVQVMSSTYEHKVVEEDESAWAWLTDNGVVEYGDVPDEKQQEVRNQLAQGAGD